MAELLGAIASGITLAALFKACIEAFDLIQTSRHQEVDLKKLKLRLNIEKCRLYIWGEFMGLTDTADAAEERLIDKFRFPEVVREILEVVFQLFHDSHKIRDKYGCRSATFEDGVVDVDQAGPISSLAATFSDFTIRSCCAQQDRSAQQSKTLKVVQKVIWVIYNRKKFGALVAEIKELVDSLQGIASPCVPVARQAGTIRRKIEKIRDAETLSLIAEVCSEDHPDIAGAASTKADTISHASTHHRHVAAWTEGVQDGPSTDRMSPDLESLTVTELKHMLLQMKQERQERGDPPASASATILPSIPDTPPPPAPPQNLRPVATQSGLNDAWPMCSMYNQLAPIFTNPWLVHTSVNNFSNPSIPEQTASFFASDNLDVSRGMLAPGLQSLSDLTPRNIYDVRATRGQSDTYGFPTSSTSASTYSATSYHDNPFYAHSVSGSITDYSSAASDAECDSRTLPRPSQLMGESFSPAPQSMMGQFSSMRSSNTQKKHKCRVCDKRFTRPSGLQTHMHSHTGEKPFACPVEGCGRHFSVISNLRRHKKFHKGEEPASDVDMDE